MSSLSSVDFQAVAPEHKSVQVEYSPRQMVATPVNALKAALLPR